MSEIPMSQVTATREGQRFLFVGEEHHDPMHLQSLVNLVENGLLTTLGVSSIYLEYFLANDSPTQMTELEIGAYLKGRRFFWNANQANLVAQLAVACQSFNITLAGLDFEKPSSFKLPIFMWRVSKELHSLWMQALLAGKGPGIKLIYGGRLHGPLLQKFEIPGLASWELKDGSYITYH